MRPRHSQSARQAARGFASAARALAVLLAISTVAAARADTTRITLRDSVALAAGQVKLADVAHVEGPAADAVAAVVVVVTPANQARLDVSLADIDRALDSAEINRGTIAISGAVRCRVDLRRYTSATEVPPQIAAVSAALANPDGEIDIHASTLRSRIVIALAELAEAPAEDLRISFSAADEAALAQAVGGDVRIEPQATVIPGRVPLVIRRQSGKPSSVQTLRITAEVARRHAAVRVKSGISRGQIFTAADLEPTQVYLTTPGQPVADIAQAVGQVSRSVLRPDAVLMVDHLAPPVLVRRGEMVNVRCVIGGLVVMTSARALEDGAMGQSIELRNEKSRQTFTAQVAAGGEVIVQNPAISPADTLAAGGTR